MRADTLFSVPSGLGIGLLLLIAIPATAQDAIFTSNGDGTCVNCNMYPSKSDVYLNGGPINCGGSTLPDGDYYFQVTNTSGSSLLSTDGLSERTVTFTGGLITAYAGSHSTGTGICGGINVALAPFNDSSNGVYKLGIIPVASCVSCTDTDPFDPVKTDNFKVIPEGGGPPQETVIISGTKFYDADTNGLQGAGEPGILGWRIEKTPPTPADITYTDSNGDYSFLVPEDSATYTISEVLPFSSSGTWVNTTPMSGAATVPGGPLTVDFGNVCVGEGGGKTLGFWSNKNGQKQITGGDLTSLSGLCLRDANGNDFDPGSASGLHTWLLDANAVNMAYMLSAQLAAMELNVLHGFVDGGALIFAGPNPDGCSVPVNAAGFISVSSLMTDANTELCADGFTPAGDSERACQEFKKNALDEANNNRNFVQPGPGSCPFTTPY